LGLCLGLPTGTIPEKMILERMINPAVCQNEMTGP